MTLYDWPLLAVHSNGAIASEMEMRRAISSGSVSSVLLPSSTLPARVVVPDLVNNASASVVLPLPLWPNRTTLRMFSVGKLFKATPLLTSPDACTCDRTQRRRAGRTPGGRGRLGGWRHR